MDGFKIKVLISAGKNMKYEVCLKIPYRVPQIQVSGIPSSEIRFKPSHGSTYLLPPDSEIGRKPVPVAERVIEESTDPSIS